MGSPAEPAEPQMCPSVCSSLVEPPLLEPLSLVELGVQEIPEGRNARDTKIFFFII